MYIYTSTVSARISYHDEKMYELINNEFVELEGHSFETINVEDETYLIIREPNYVLLNRIHEGKTSERRVFVLDKFGE